MSMTEQYFKSKQDGQAVGVEMLERGRLTVSGDEMRYGFVIVPRKSYSYKEVVV
jgi:hypothetical protein